MNGVRTLLAITALLVAPLARAGASITSGLNNVHRGAPGTVVEGQIRVKNTGDVAWSGRAYETDYATELPRQALFPDAGTTARSAAEWLRVTPEWISLAPGEEGVLRYEATIPEAADDGTFWSVVMVEDSAPSAPSGGEGTAVRQSYRTAVRVTIDVGTDGEAALEFVGTSLEQVEGRTLLDLDLRNTGTRWANVAPRVELYDATGAKVATKDAQAHGLYPGSSLRIPVDLEGVPSGAYSALVLADGGSGTLFGTRLDLIVP